MKNELRKEIKKKLQKDNVEPNNEIKNICNSFNFIAMYKSLPEEMNTEEIINDLIKKKCSWSVWSLAPSNLIYFFL